MIFPLSSTGWNCTPHRAPIRRCRTRRTHQGAAPVVARGRGIHAVCSSASGNKAWERTQQASNLRQRKPMVRQRRTKSSWRPVRGAVDCMRRSPLTAWTSGVPSAIVPVSRSRVGEDPISFGRHLYGVVEEDVMDGHRRNRHGGGETLRDEDSGSGGKQSEMRQPHRTGRWQGV
jgi:hypothetical protein